MAITDVLAEIKDYFLNWHRQNYNTLHTETINALNTETTNRIQGDQALGTRIDNLTASQIKDNANNNTQTTLTNLQNQKLSTNSLAKAGNRSLQTDYNATDEEAGARGFVHIINTPRTNGVMTWQDKAVLKGLGDWLELTQTDWPSIPTGFRIWVNPSLRIVYAKFYVKNCTWLKNSTEYFSVRGSDTTYAWHHIRPIGNIWAPTNVIGVQIGVNTDGDFYLKSDRKIAKHTFHASLFWFYRDSNMYDKLRTERV